MEIGHSYFPMSRSFRVFLSAVVTVLTPGLASGQADVANEPADINNGSNPILLTTQAGIRYQYNEINSDLNTRLFEALCTQPFGAGGKRALRITVPRCRLHAETGKHHILASNPFPVGSEGLLRTYER